MDSPNEDRRHSRVSILADGRRDRRLLGEALFTISELNETLTCPVIFAPKDSLFLLGATALENFGVEADTTARKLKAIMGIIGCLPNLLTDPDLRFQV